MLSCPMPQAQQTIHGSLRVREQKGYFTALTVAELLLTQNCPSKADVDVTGTLWLKWAVPKWESSVVRL